MAKVRPIRIVGDLAYVTLTQGYEAVIDACDAYIVQRYNWRAKVDYRSVYASRLDRSGGKQKDVLMHRALLGDPKGLQVDHIDGDGLNNRRENLRAATRAQNQHNAKIRSDNPSGFKGVGWHKATGKWVARIKVDGRQRHLGVFDDPKDAHEAYCKASKEFYGEFGRGS